MRFAAAALGGFVGFSFACTQHIKNVLCVSTRNSCENCEKSGKQQSFSSNLPEGQATASNSSAALSTRFKPFKLGQIIPISHDVALFRFLLPSPDDTFNLRPCSTLQACYKKGVQTIDQCVRFYTPVTPNGTKGYFDIIVKKKPGGPMTNHIFGLHVGDTLLFRVIGLKLQYKANRWDCVGMIAGGTGITPMLQVIQHALKGAEKEKDNSRFSLLYCNRTEQHILLKGLLDDFASAFPARFRVAYCVDSSIWPSEWSGYTGLVDERIISSTMPSPDDKSAIIFLCGPDGLLNHIAGVPGGASASLSSGQLTQPVASDINNLVGLGGLLGKIGYDASRVYKF